MNVLEYWNNVCTAHTLSIWTSSIIPNHNDTNSLLVHLKRKWKTKLSGRKWTKSIISMSAYHSQRQDVCRFRSTCPCHIYLDVPVRSGNTTWKNRNAMAKNTDIYWFVQFRLFENCSQGKCRWWRQTHTHGHLCRAISLTIKMTFMQPTKSTKYQRNVWICKFVVLNAENHSKFKRIHSELRAI